jgi:hypothetical protein
LRAGQVILDSLELPKVHCGQFAAVFQLKVEDTHWAVRCFLSNLSDRTERYHQISEFVRNHDVDSLVGFQLIERGIKVNGSWFPILKMPFVQGTTFGNYIQQNVSDTNLIANLLQEFHMMISLKHHERRLA